MKTSSAPIADFDLTEPIYQSLKRKKLLPAIYLADTGLVDAGLLLVAQDQYEIDLFEPSHLDAKRIGFNRFDLSR